MNKWDFSVFDLVSLARCETKTGPDEWCTGRSRDFASRTVEEY
jgi:hypothetical protein